MSSDVVVIRKYPTMIEAQLAQATLQASEIPAIVLADNGGGMLPMLQIAFPIRLAVRSEHADEAREILDEIEAGEGEAPEGGIPLPPPA
jgi:hypothetical protein